VLPPLDKKFTLATLCLRPSFFFQTVPEQKTLARLFVTTMSRKRSRNLSIEDVFIDDDDHDETSVELARQRARQRVSASSAAAAAAFAPVEEDEGDTNDEEEDVVQRRPPSAAATEMLHQSQLFRHLSRFLTNKQSRTLQQTIKHHAPILLENMLEFPRLARQICPSDCGAQCWSLRE
jgi:hypothetical protein